MTNASMDNWRYPGARWWKFDFHTHTPASSDTPWYKLADQPDALTAEQWLKRYMDAGIDCVAITDHNSGAWIDKVKAAYDAMKLSGIAGFRPLHVFPGVEISVNGGFHLLAIFDKEKCTADVDTLLGAVDYAGTKGDSDGVTRKSPVEVVEAVLAAGGLPIPAHADQPKGFLRLQEGQSGKAALDANTLGQVLECSGVLAMEVLDRQAPKPRVYSQRGLSWAEVLGSDCHNFRGQNLPGTRFTWIKMASPSLEGLRLALLDGEGFSVRRSDDPRPFDPFALPEHFVESIAISKARYMGRSEPEKLVFSPWFNALVGGRGTGKSTVVHFLRLGFRREAELRTLETDHEARRTFDAFAKPPSSKADVGGLETQTEVLITLMRDGVRHQLTWRHGVADGLVQEDTGGQWAPSASQLVTRERFPLRLFSQGQIGALAGKNQEALLAVIDEAAGAAPQKDALEEASRRFLALQAQGRQLDGQLRGQEPLRVQLDDVRRKLARFESTHHTEVLRAYQIGARQEREMARQLDAADRVAAKVRQVAEELVPDDVPQGLFDTQSPQDQEALAAIDRLGLAVLDLGKAVHEAAARLRAVVDKERASQGTWHTALAETKTKYLALVEALQAQGVADPSEYAKLVQERQRLEAEWAKFESLRKQREQLSVQTMEQTERLLAARRALGVQRQEFLQGTLAGNSYVQIATVPYGNDPRALERSLREVLGAVDDRFGDDILSMSGDQAAKGLVAALLGVPDQFGFPAPDGPLGVTELRIDRCKRRIQQACLGSGDFGGHFNNYLKKVFEKSPEFLDRVLTWFPEDALSIKYSRKGDGNDWEPIGQASAGQRAAAMLAFLLAHGREPIVLDQPEDDLDNHLIYDLVVRQIRANKLHRQIIVVTHNPNIVVNGDAEMLQAFDFRGGQCRVVQSGSLQDPAMREEICNVMEGGREAFDRRYRRLGKEA